MQVLYVTNFDVAATGEPGSGCADPAMVCLELLGEWIGGHTDPAVPAAELLRDGRAELALAHGQERRHATWEHVNGADSWATRLERRDEAGDGSAFVTRVTVGHHLDGASLRVSMAREVTSARLNPTTAVQVRQPALLAQLVEDRRLKVRVAGQAQDGRYVQMRSREEITVLAESLASENRLPVLLIHTRTLEAQAAARRAAGRLIGLVRVVTLDYRAARQLRELEPAISLPYAGGLLVWADMGAPPAQFTSEQVNASESDLLTASLMRRVAPLSVLTRGTDSAYRRARQGAQALDMRRIEQRSAEAASSGDLAAQLAASLAENAQLKAEVEETTDAWAQSEQLADERAHELARLTAKLEQLDAQLDQLSVVHQYQAAAAAAEQEPSLENAPTALATGDVDALEELCQHLEKATGGRIAFTPNATAAWRKAAEYPTPDDMRTALVKLAGVAFDLYDGQDRTMGHLDTWIRENYDLKVSLQDDQMPKKLRQFTWEDRDYDRVPHVQVNDGVPPKSCGRIYFALDPDQQRILVDHIGLHW